MNRLLFNPAFFSREVCYAPLCEYCYSRQYVAVRLVIDYSTWEGVFSFRCWNTGLNIRWCCVEQRLVGGCCHLLSSFFKSVVVVPYVFSVVAVSSFKGLLHQIERTRKRSITVKVCLPPWIMLYMLYVVCGSRGECPLASGSGPMGSVGYSQLLVINLAITYPGTA